MNIPVNEWTIFEMQTEAETYSHAVIKKPHDVRASLVGHTKYDVIEKRVFLIVQRELEKAQKEITRLKCYGK